MILEKLKEILAEQFMVDADSITMVTSFADDLGADSLDIVETAMAIEEQFGIPELPEDALPGLQTVGDVVNYISNLID